MEFGVLNTIKSLPVPHHVSRHLSPPPWGPARTERDNRGWWGVAPYICHRPTPASRPVRMTTVHAAMSAPLGLGRAIATPILATGQVFLSDPNLMLGLSAVLGAGVMQWAHGQHKTLRVACVALAAASPWAMRSALGAVMVHMGIDAAKVPLQTVLDTALASITGTTLALLSSLMRPPWRVDAPAAVEGPLVPLVARFALAAALGPVLFHTLMAATLPNWVQTSVRAMNYWVHPALFLAARC